MDGREVEAVVEDFKVQREILVGGSLLSLLSLLTVAFLMAGGPPWLYAEFLYCL